MRKLYILVAVVCSFALGAVGMSIAAGGDAGNIGPSMSKAGTSAINVKIKSAGFAVVGGDGVLARGKNAVSSARFADGRYEVVFNRDVTRCAYTATIGQVEGSGIEPTGQITTAPRAGNANGVFITTEDSAGNQSDRDFHLLVSC
jgi:hypothetical protein